MVRTVPSTNVLALLRRERIEVRGASIDFALTLTLSRGRERGIESLAERTEEVQVAWKKGSSWNEYQRAQNRREDGTR
jgi:hypothetical protein